MTTKKDEPGKDPLRPGETAGGKKPHATIDLKATEITDSKTRSTTPEASKNTDAKSADAKSAGDKSTGGPAGAPTPGAAPAQGSKPAQSSTPPSGTKPGTDSKPAPASPSSAGAAGASSLPPSSAQKPETKESKPGNTGKDTQQQAPANRARGGGFLTHLTAGIVGGFLALLGADMLGPQIPPIADSLGLPSATHQTLETTAELERRLARLEQTAEADRSLVSRLDATDSRIAALENLQNSVSALQEAQADLTQKAAALDEKLQAVSEGTVPEARLSKLEQQFETIVASAGDDQSGLPQLAALAGRLSDLEATLNNQISALRESVNQDVETRIAAVAETSEAARSGTQRMDRELANVTTEAARLGQRIETLKADGNRISETLRVVQEETAAIRSELDAFSGDISQRIAKLTTADDVASAIRPVEEKVAGLANEVSGVVAAEADRRANAQRIVLSLELANLKRAVDRGAGYADELNEVRKAATGLLDLTALEPYEKAGVATLADLQTSFRPIANAIIDAAAVPEDGSVLDQLIAGARSVVRIRKVNYDPNDQSVEAITGRISTALADGRLGDVLAEAEKLPDTARRTAADWLKSVEARHAVDQALGLIEGQLKASLSSAPASSDANAN